MGLHLLPKKSWHVYNADNVERVRRDEAAAEAANDVEEKRSMLADSEARLSNLRKQAKKRLKGQQDEAEAALDRQLKGKGRAQPDEDEEDDCRAVIVRAPAAAPPASDPNSSIELDGHINFWADLERGAIAGKSSTAATKATNPEYEAEAKKEKTKFDEQITMYIREPPAPWYSDPSLATPADRKRTVDQRLEAAYKDGESKRLSDPLAVMNGYLDRREKVLSAQDRLRRDPWGATPKTLIDPSPVQPSLLRPRKRTRRTPSPDLQSFAPPPPPRAKLDAVNEARQREATERERARALLAKARRGGTSTVVSTPRSEIEFGTGQYNAEATARARNLSHVRWDDHRRHYDRDDRERERERDRRRYDDQDRYGRRR